MEDSPKFALKSYVLAGIARLFAKTLSATYRIEWAGGRELLDRLDGDSEPHILCLWHNRLVFFGIYLEKLIKQGVKMTLMVSLSKDGEVGTIFGRRAGAQVVRGSSSREGTKGLRAMYRAVAKERRSIFILPDGSKGPIYKAKAGAVVLSKMTGASMLPISWSADRYWRFGSWDRMILPKPFARVVLSVGVPISIDRKADSETQEAVRVELEDSLSSMRETTDRYFGNKSASKEEGK